MDIQMPGMDGLEAIRRVRAHSDPRIASIPIIAITALAMPGDKERCFEAGANEFVSKPFNLINLIGVLQQLLDRGK
jgi:CheY-like chemotaxis protein